MTTATTTTTATATSGSAILTALGAGSGIDTNALVTNLVSASFDPKDAALKAKQDANTAQISSLGTLTSGIDAFATALQTLVSGGTLRSQPSSSNTAIVTVSANNGADISTLASSIEVRQLAQSQTVVSAALTGSAPTVGLGSLKLTTPAGDFNVAITADNNSLDGLAKAINDLNAGATPSGVTASVVSDASGKRLVVKGATGAANSFTLTPNGDASSDLTRFAYADPAISGSSTTLAQAAADAIVRADGVDAAYSTNTVTDLIPGVTLNLLSAQVGTSVKLGVTRPTDAITQAVGDFVSAYNEMKSQIDALNAPATATSDAGALHGVPAVQEMLRQLKKMTSTPLTNSGTPQTLAEIGVSTGQDGTLSVDSSKLAKALANSPDAVEAMFNPSQHSSDPRVQITSAMSATKPGTYTLSDVSITPTLAAKVNGVPFLPSASSPGVLVASITSAAYGLAIKPLANVGTATITVDPGLSGILQAIRDDLRRSGTDDKDNGALTQLGKTLAAQTKSLAAARDQLDRQESTYKDQLTSQFSTMQDRVASYKSIQSYLTQQIDAWSNKG